MGALRVHHGQLTVHATVGSDRSSIQGGYGAFAGPDAGHVHAGARE